MYKVATFNVNSIKSRSEILINWLKEESIDVVLLQELKCTENNFPREVIEEAGYNFAVSGQKTYNGVAILSKTPIEEVKSGFLGNPDPAQARFIEADSYLGKELFKFISVYVPNGQNIESDKFSYKLEFLRSLYYYLKDLASIDQKIIIGGDFNVALTDLDVFDPMLDGQVCYHPSERELIRKIINLGFSDIFRDLHHNKSSFTWWDYRAGSWQQNKGMRIDYLLLNHLAAQSSKACYIDDRLRALPSPSDHAPVIVCL
jgi:exodeoxyribonuclease-3